MQRLIYSALSLLVLLGLLLFALPVFLIFAAVAIVFILIGMLTGRASFTVYHSRPRPQNSQPRQSIDKNVIDITEDQEKK